MSRFLSAALALAFVASLSLGADAKSCRDAKGKFVKCPPSAMAPMPMKKKCRDKKGHFIKCAPMKM
jgi:hypothetical protein